MLRIIKINVNDVYEQRGETKYFDWFQCYSVTKTMSQLRFLALSKEGS